MSRPDSASGIELLASRRDKDHTINLAYGQGNTLIAMAEHIGDVLGIKPEITVEDSRVGEVTHYVANIGKARSLLGYAPTTPLDGGIRRSIEWSREFEEKKI